LGGLVQPYNDRSAGAAHHHITYQVYQPTNNYQSTTTYQLQKDYQKINNHRKAYKNRVKVPRCLSTAPAPFDTSTLDYSPTLAGSQNVARPSMLPSKTERNSTRKPKGANNIIQSKPKGKRVELSADAKPLPKSKQVRKSEAADPSSMIHELPTLERPTKPVKKRQNGA
jgi:hypothetical protein